MNNVYIEIIQQAKGAVEFCDRWEEARPLVLLVNGYRWYSPMPENAGEAESFNRIAAAMIANATHRAQTPARY